MLHQTYDNLLHHKTKLDLNIGKLLNNRYLIRDLIGKGRVSKVYLAEDAAKGGTPVAIKILFLNSKYRQISPQFVQEIFIATQLGLKNNHIVSVLDYGVTDDQNLFYVMEYLQGKNLKHIITSRSLTLPKFLNICHQICLGLQCAYSGLTLKGRLYPIIHRNLKPENIFITDDIKKGEIIKILDFGIANFLAELSQVAFTESLIHNLPYCSPEYMDGYKLLDVSSDIYSLGIIMYEMLVGKHPLYTKNNTFGSWHEAHRFQSPFNFKEIIPQFKIPQSLQQLIMSCLAKDPSLRPQNIDEIILYLENINSSPKLNFYKTDSFLANNYKENAFILDTFFSEKICFQTKWPQKQPVEPICFPHTLNTREGDIPIIMVMLPKKEIKKFTKKSHHAEFISQTDLYPMLLWITMLEAPKLELVGWLSHFLDLKDNKNLNILQLLFEKGYYHLLFFSLENPDNCSHVMTINLDPHQRQKLSDCLESYQIFQPVISSKQSQAFLKCKFEKFKRKQLHKIAVQSTSKKVVNFCSKYLEKLMSFKIS